MKSRVKGAVFFCIMAALAGVYSVIDKNHAVYDEKVDKEAYAMVSLGEGDLLEQNFLAEENVLDGVNVKMSASGDIGDAEISFMLADEDGGKAAEGTKALNDLKPGKFFPLKFDSVEGCKGKTYSFRLTVEKCGEDARVQVYAVPGASEAAPLSVEGKAAEGTLALRAVTHRFDAETFIVTLCFLLYVVLFMKWLARLFK